VDKVEFDKNQTEFSTPRHKAIWDEGLHIIPLETSLTDIEDPEMREGCGQIYEWAQEYYEAIYTNPEEYSGHTPFEMFFLLDFIAKNAEIRNGGLVFNQEKYKELLRLRKEHIPDLSLVGLDIEDDGYMKILTNKKYPLFCKYYKLFHDAKINKKIMARNYLDFRVLAHRYKRTIDDLLRVLPDRLGKYAIEIHEYALKKGAKPELPKYYTVARYKYKNEFLLSLGYDTGQNIPLIIGIPFGLSGFRRGYGGFMEVIETQPDKEELIAYVIKEICKCNACWGSKKVSNRCGIWTDIHGARRMICGDCGITKSKAPKSNLEYSDYDIKMLKRMIDLRIIQIDGLEKGE